MKLELADNQAKTTQHTCSLRREFVSLAPGFSRVSGVQTGTNRFNGFWGAGEIAKPLKRFRRHGTAYTRLKPGVNEIGFPKLCAFASLRLCVKKS
jgi:hypothetical protein